MDWVYIAELDYSIYQDKMRLRNFVIKGKISETDFKNITSEDY